MNVDVEALFSGVAAGFVLGIDGSEWPPISATSAEPSLNIAPCTSTDCTANGDVFIEAA